MKTIKRDNGNDIKIFATTLEDVALDQIIELGEFEAYKDSKIRVMPDCHAGAGCTIGTTIEIKDKVTPNLVGVDIGCGMLTVKLSGRTIDLPKLDEVINKFVPSGFNIHNKQQSYFDFSTLIANGLNIDRAKLSLGTLGGGNHFIEVGKTSTDELFLVIHSGSRNIGGQVAKHYQNLAINKITRQQEENRDRMISNLRKAGRQNEINTALREMKKEAINKDLAYLIGEDFDNYMHDMSIMQQFAILNRRTIADIILREAGLIEEEVMSFETTHNYIDFNRMILRKGAVSATKGELLLIPINMRDGSIIAVGKGNEDWNYSAPHGAGRLMGRRQAHKNLDFDEFNEQMKGIYSTSILMETLDEAPDAYKPIEEILAAIGDTVEVIDVIKPIYNFKAH